MPVVTVVPSDRIIILDGMPLIFDFPAPVTMHALQWNGQQGHIEWEDDYNWPLPAADTTAYEDEVAPYVALWKAEKARLEQESEAAEAARLAEYNSTAARAARLRAKRDARLASTDKYLLPDYPIDPERLEAAKAYRQALRALPQQPDAPWDGGGELTPWPDMPEV